MAAILPEVCAVQIKCLNFFILDVRKTFLYGVFDKMHQHYDLCPVDSCVNLLSALDSRNGVMSMRTSPHLRALLINNNPCGQQFS